MQKPSAFKISEHFLPQDKVSKVKAFVHKNRKIIKNAFLIAAIIQADDVALIINRGFKMADRGASYICRSLDLEEQNGVKVQQLIDHLTQQYGVKIEFDPYLVFTQEQKEKTLNKLVKILGKYPPELIASCHLKVVFSRYLDGANGYMKSGVPGNADGTGGNWREVVMSISSFNVGTTHHEIAHVMDDKYGAMMKGESDDQWHDDESAVYYNDENWAKLNPEGKEVYTNSFSSLGVIYDYFFKKEKGFAKDYGGTNENEDQATVEETMIDQPEEIRMRIETDEVLAGKVRQVRQYLSELSHGKMDEKYWQDLAAGKVNEKYWERR